ncbi:hypothetical protein HQ496_12190 [bacterium]|nr:hypothetical protein [bacterium]
MLRISLLVLLTACSFSNTQAQRIVHIESNKANANVFADSEWIGTVSNSPFEVLSTVKKISVIQPELDLWLSKPFVFDLEGLDKKGEYTLEAIFEDPPAPLTSQLQQKGVGVHVKRRKWISYTAAGTSVVAGILAIHFRTKADNRFEDFLESGSPALKKSVQRLDVQSGLALGAMQIGVGVIAFRLVF